MFVGAFLYSRTAEMTPGLIQKATDVIRKAGLNPNDFCMIRNQCFLSEQSQQKQQPDWITAEGVSKGSGSSIASSNPFSYSSAAVAATGKTRRINLL